MSIYDINGNALTSANGIDGTTLPQSYDVNGNIIWTRQPNSIKVMTYNVGGWYIGSKTNVPADKDAEYYALQNGMISNDDADILCINEYTKQFSKLPRTAISLLEQYYPYIHEQGGDTATVTNGRCICSKYPITNYATHQYSQSGSPRYFDTCTITVGNIPITVVVTHLNYNATSDTARVAQLNELISYLQTQERFIACGDFNTLDCKNTSGVDYTKMIVPMLNAGFNLANCSDFGFLITYSDEPTDTWTGCLDNIVTSSNINILSATVDTTKLNDNLTERTDHMPLIATVELI